MSGLGKRALCAYSVCMITFEKMNNTHWPQVWAILQPVFEAGETYPQATDTSEAEARGYWMELPLKSYVAVKGGTVLGVFYIKPNQPALGAHVCNCGYAVAPAARGQGVGGLMCDWSQTKARRLGYLAMQYNLVVSTNKVAVALWQRHGFAIVGRLTKAFRHKRLGLVDAFVMYKAL